MERPDFGIVKQWIEKAQELKASMEEIFEGTERLEAECRNAYEEKRMDQARWRLKDFPVSELKASKSGIRVSVLEEAGYHDLKSLYEAEDGQLRAIPGIGEKQLQSVRTLTEQFLHSLGRQERVFLTEETGDPAVRGLIVRTARFRRADLIRKEASQIREEVLLRTEKTLKAVKIRNRVHWMFSLPGTKADTILGVTALVLFCESPLCHRVRELSASYKAAAGLEEEESREDFVKNSASFFVLAEKMLGDAPPRELIYSSIPVRLAEEISEEELRTDNFMGTLRPYQEFGTRYILHQKRVLLGDEMGLGKTIQAIAAMAHLDREEPGRHFLIVCPASVLVNWCREIQKFSRIKTHLIHGPSLENALAAWKQDGGAAVTNYESMGKIIHAVDNRMKLSLLVIDEAHYIKNPEALRTRQIRRLEDEAERILLMTGTPLENRVEEMCELIRFVRPDLEKDVREKAMLRLAPEFRELLAPVYLRRTREQVLQELPPLAMEEEWCAMTPEDLEHYGKALETGNFMAIRRISFLQEDLRTSSKAVRLKELCGELGEEGRKAVIYSYFRETIAKVQEWMKEACIGSITGSTPAAERQELADRLADAPPGSVLLCQVQAGGIGMNLQEASVVIFCEPQIKPSLTRQALSRVYRMGQRSHVLVFSLLCGGTVDEQIMELQVIKQGDFDLYADSSVMAEAEDTVMDREWIHNCIEKEREKYLPALILSDQ